ncbi:MAG TPA: nucleotidyltransferase domain-containing protein [Acidobacteriota bacterium]|nr:nucleotidyltransferase domain-containing protein [Acidobacteriota bacterium]HQM64889.1 nucleotidyltransferase domain-containing protein [Acidobacteriota bacterium]
MRAKDLAIARELKARLARFAGLVDFKVFGSRARAAADTDSDLDIFIAVESLDGETREKISEIVWEVGFQNETVISPLIFTRDELENSPLRSSPIIEVIAEEGVAV